MSAMHISASVFVNDHEPGLWKDILDWLESRIAPWSPEDYRHNSGTGEDNAAAHLRSLTVGHEVIVPVTKGEARLRAVAARFLRRVGRPASEARAAQGDGRVASNFSAASSAPLKPMRLCVPSQNGLVTDAPHRHSEIHGFSGFRSGSCTGLPSWSISLTSPCTR